jgi:hypothetical protein
MSEIELVMFVFGYVLFGCCLAQRKLMTHTSKAVLWCTCYRASLTPSIPAVVIISGAVLKSC